MAWQTMAQYDEERISLRCYREAMTILLSERFGEITPEIQKQIENVRDRSWLKKVFETAITIPSLADLQFNPPKKSKK